MVRCGSTASVERWFSACRLHPRLRTYPVARRTDAMGQEQTSASCVLADRKIATIIRTTAHQRHSISDRQDNAINALVFGDFCVQLSDRRCPMISVVRIYHLPAKKHIVQHNDTAWTDEPECTLIVAV